MGKKTVTSREVQTAVRLVLAGELAKHAVSEGTKAVTKYNMNAAKGGSKSVRAGLQFPVTKIHTMVKEARVANRVGDGVGVYLAVRNIISLSFFLYSLCYIFLFQFLFVISLLFLVLLLLTTLILYLFSFLSILSFSSLY